AKSFRHGWRDVLEEDADLAAVHVALLLQLAIDVACDVTRDGEADSFAAPRLREDEGVDAREAAIHADERSAAVARVDRGVGLDVDHRALLTNGARGGADDAHRNRIP